MRILPVLLLCAALAVPAADDQAALRAELEAVADTVTLPRAANLIHRLVANSVVSIHITQQRRYGSPLGVLETREVEVGEGSGFVIHRDDSHSWIMTNAHVVIRTDQQQRFIKDRRSRQPLWYERISVMTDDRQAFDAVPVGADLQSDLAVLRIDGVLPGVDWADSDLVEVGDLVFALGYPLGVGYSASLGIVSATGRSTGIYASELGYESFIQTDAAINPGNSGGPLVDLRGRVVGVNANIVSRGGGSIGVGFAIPANLAQRVGEDLVEHGEVRRPMVGIEMAELEPGEHVQLGLPGPGVRVTMVLPASPAESAGLHDGDIIVGVDAQAVRDLQQLRSRIAATRIGEVLPLRVWRDGAIMTLEVRPIGRDELLETLAERAAQSRSQRLELPNFGLDLGRDRLRGAVILAVVPDSAAAKAGLEPGDRILTVSGHGPVTDLAPLAALDATRSELVIEVFHRGRSYLIRLRR